MFLMVPFYTRYLSPEEYGTADMVIVYGTMLLGIVTCQVQDAVFVFPKGRPIGEQRAYFLGGTCFLCVAYAATAVLFVVLNSFLPNSTFFRRYCWLIYFYLLGMGVQNYLQQFCRAIDKMVLYATVGFVFTVASALAAIIWIPISRSGVVIIRSQFFGFAMAALAALIGGRLWRYLGQCGWTCLWNRLLEMLEYSIPLIPTGAMWWAISALNRPFLEHYHGLASVGVYAAAVKIPAILSMLWGIVGNAWQISVLEEFGKPGYLRYYRQFFWVMAGCLALATVLLSVLAPWYMSFVVGREYYQARTLIPFLSVGATFSILGGVIGANFTATKKSKYFLYSSVWALVAVVVFNAILIPHWGIKGAAIANVATLTVELVVRMLYVRKILKGSIA